MEGGRCARGTGCGWATRSTAPKVRRRCRPARARPGLPPQWPEADSRRGFPTVTDRYTCGFGFQAAAGRAAPPCGCRESLRAVPVRAVPVRKSALLEQRQPAAAGEPFRVPAGRRRAAGAGRGPWRRPAGGRGRARAPPRHPRRAGASLTLRHNSNQRRPDPIYWGSRRSLIEQRLELVQGFEVSVGEAHRHRV